MTVLTALLLLLAPPEDPEKLSAEALQNAQSGRIEHAETLWKRALAAAPNHFPSLFNYGFMLYSNQRFQEAEPLLARAAKARPADFNSRFILGSTLVKLDHREDGLVQWRAALALQPANIRLMQIMSVEYTAGRYFNEACEIGQKAVRIKGDTPEPWLIAIKACEDAQSPAAFTLAKEAASKFAQSARAVFEYAFQLQRSGRREEALPLLEQAMKLDPNYEEPFYFSGTLLLLEDRYEEAAAQLSTALRIRPDYAAACVSLAKALMALEQYPAAVAGLDRLRQGQPDSPAAAFAAFAGLLPHGR